MKSGKILSAVLAVLMCLTVLFGATACKEKTPNNPAQTSGGTGGTDGSSGTTPETKEFIDKLGEYNFGKETVNILSRSSKVNADLDASSDASEPVSVAIYRRNRKIEDRFNVTLNFIPLDDDSALWQSTLLAENGSATGAYDFVLPDYWWGCEAGGYFLNLLEYNKIFDFDQPWWTPGWNENCTIFGQMYSAVGSLSLDLINNSNCMIFNLKVLNDFKLESPFKLVDDKQWTIDKVISMVKTVTSDLNSDGVFDADHDRIGSNYWMQSGRGLLTGFGVKYATKTSDGAYEYSFYNDTFVEKFNKAYDYLNNTAGVVYELGDALNGILSDRVLFLNDPLTRLSSLRDMDSDYGVVPYPMYDEAQGQYYTYNYGTYYAAVLNTSRAPEMSAVILEALNAESYHTVKDTYFVETLKIRYGRDEVADNPRMLDLIIDSIYFDFTFVNEASTNHIAQFFSNMICFKDPNLQSQYEANAAGFQSALDTLFETYRRNLG